MKPPHPAAALLLALAFASTVLAGAAPADTPRKLKADPSQEYHLYLPKGHDPKEQCWLLVAVHAAKGDGAGALGLSKIADEGGGIVLAPTFKGDFQDPAKGSGNKLKAILREVQAECRLQPKVFVTGFGEGAAFAHRFALDNASMVLGCAGHSADKWESPNPQARSVPFLVTCGQDDKKPNRIGEAQKFAKALKDKKFEVQTLWLKGVGHAFDAKASEKTKDFFYKLTTGMNAWERQKAQSCLSKASAALKGKKFLDALVAARELADMKPSAAYLEKAKGIVTQVDAAAAARLAAIEKQAKKDPEATVAALAKLQEDFPTTPTAEAAAQRLKALEQAIKQGAEEATHDGDAPPGKADPATVRARCNQWFLLADNYVANGKVGAARLTLFKIIESYPDSEFAAKAKARLDQLR